MQGPYDVEFRTISVSRELTQRSLEHRRQLDEAKRAERVEAPGASLPPLQRFVQRCLGFVRPGRDLADDGAGPRAAATISEASSSHAPGGMRAGRSISNSA